MYSVGDNYVICRQCGKEYFDLKISADEFMRHHAATECEYIVITRNYFNELTERAEK